MRKVATIEIIGYSTRINGFRLTDHQVENLLGRLHISRFRTRDEQEVASYGDVMYQVFDASDQIPVTENIIGQLHQDLLRYSTKDERHRGHYKTLPNHVAAFDADGKEIGIVFQTTAPFDTPREMEALVAWFTKASRENSLHPLLLIGSFIVVFLAIHPFQDGNSRLSRVLTTLMLLHAGFAYLPYSSLESIIEASKEGCYRALRRTQTTLQSEKPDWEDWLMFFLRSLVKQKEAPAKKIAIEDKQTTDLHPWSKWVAELRATFPDMIGFLARSVWEMKRLYEAYSAPDFRSQVVRELSNPTFRPTLQQLVAEIPWGHNLLILNKLTAPAARLWYPGATASLGWSRNVLLNQIRAGAYARAVTEKKTHNFDLALPEHVAEQAEEMLKSS